MTGNASEEANIEDYSFDRAYETNIIYIYTIDAADHAGCVKVGKASIAKQNPTGEEVAKAAKERIGSQLRTAGIKCKSFYAEVAVRTDSDGVPHSFWDHEVHDVLLRSGIKKKKFGTNAQEWFECSMETAKAAIRAVKENRQSLNAQEVRDDFEAIKFRPEQRKAIDQTRKIFAKENDMLWNAKMRFGKTVTALQLVREMEFHKTLIFTHRPVVVKGWHEDFQKIFFDCEDFAFGSKMGYGADIDWLERSGKNYVFFASLQDLRGSELVGGNYDKNQEVYVTDWDCIIIDEAHEGTLTDIGEKVFERLKKPHTKVLRLSGTPFNLLDKFSAANTYTWDYVMEQRAKALWDVEHPDEPNPYSTLPAMCIYTYDISRLLGDDEVEEDSAFNFREFFRIDGDYDNFVHEERVKDFLNLLVDNDADSMYPFSNERFENTFRHTLWMVPGVKAARALSALLKRHDTFRKYTIVNVAGDGDEEEEHDEALRKVENAIGKDPTKTRTITLSCGKLTTGVSVPAWTGVLMLCGSVNTAASAYMQTIFRVQTPCNLGGLQKEICYVFDFAPDRTLQVLADVAHVENVGKGTSDAERKALGDFLNFCPVISYENSQMQQYSTDLLFQKMKRVFVERVVKSGFEDDHIYNQQMLRNLNADEAKEFENLRAIIGSTKAMPKSKGVDLATSGMTEEEYREAEETESEVKRGKKKQSELTEEQKRNLERLKAQREQAKAAAGILRGISIRMPLMVYGANLKDEKKELTIDNFTKLVDDESWAEFMPEGVSKEKFVEFKRFFDKDIFAAASLRIRSLAREADEMNIEERIEQIYTIFNYFRNPDKETVLTPPRVVNMHMGDTLGGWNFYRKTNECGETYYDDTQSSEPVFCAVEGVTDDVFATDSRVLEINSKSGLYPLYVAYSIYRKRLEQAAKRLTLQEQHNVWDETVASNIFVVCKTPMAAAITRRTLCGFRKVKCNAKHYPNLLSDIKNNQPQLIARLRMGRRFWGANAYDNMKFNAVVGNPPYQEVGGSGGTNDAPIYQHFCILANTISSRFTSVITPSRWFSGGRENLLGGFRRHMLTCGHLKQLFAYTNARDIFNNVEIKGGICYYLYDNAHKGTCCFTLNDNGVKEVEAIDLSDFDILIRRPKLAVIIKKIENVRRNNCIDSLDSIISADTPFGIPTNPSSSSKTPFCLFKDSSPEHDVIVLYLESNKRHKAFCRRNDIKKNCQDIDRFKMCIPKAGGTGNDAQVLGKTEILPKGSVCSQTFLYSAFDSEYEAKALSAYMRTRFLRAVVSSVKIGPDAMSNVYRYVPLQDFTPNSDIDWSQDVAGIDRQLYAKYGLSAEEVAFIEERIKPME